MTLPPTCEGRPFETGKESTSRWLLTWRVMVSALYHQKRERFLDGADRAAQAISVLAGAAAFAKFFESSSGLSVPAAVVAIVGTAALCYGPSAKARKHAELARKFKVLHSEIIKCEKPFSPQIESRFESEILLLEADEPAALGALVRQCENELSTAIGKPEDIIPLTVTQRLFVNVFDFDMSARGPSKIGWLRRSIAWVFRIPMPPAMVRKSEDIEP
jgi:hypothetical protein